MSPGDARRGVWGKPETFDFLGFTHFCGFTKGGRFWLRRITIRKRMQAKLREVNDQLKRRRHQPIPKQGKWLRSVVTGHLAYYAVPGNTECGSGLSHPGQSALVQALRRRSQRTRLNWNRMDRLITKWLPPARVRHPFPDARFDARIQGRSPVRRRHAGICAGGRSQERSLPRSLRAKPGDTPETDPN